MPMRTLLALTVLAGAAACSDGGVAPVETSPSLDVQVRQAINGWGVVPILPVIAPDPALVDLGRSLFFDKILSGNRDVSCASCHDLAHAGSDGLSLAIGTGAVRAGTSRLLGQGRQFAPRNAPALFGASLRPVYLFWDGRVSEFGAPSGFASPAGSGLPPGLSSGLAAQAMFPVTNRVEMRGNAGDNDVFGNPNELAALADTQYVAIWSTVMRRVLAVNAYVQKFNAAYPSVPTGQLGFQHAANAIAAFEVATFVRTGSPFDRYLARDDAALSVDAKRGALLFFGKARCSQCHNGPRLGGENFANTGAPQLGPGTGAAAPLDVGRGDPAITGQPQFPKFFFRVPPLRNVELSAPYMHDGVYPTLEAVVRHYNNVDSAVTSYDVSQLDPSVRSSYHGDAATVNQLLSSLDGRLRQPLALTTEEQRQLVAFLESLTDPSARDLRAMIPATVPSGLPVTP